MLEVLHHGIDRYSPCGSGGGKVQEHSAVSASAVIMA